MNKCPICGEGHVSRKQESRTVEYRGTIGRVTAYHSLCDFCGAETVDNDESTLNRRCMNRFKKQVDGVPLGVQIRTMREAAGLRQRQAGELFGGGPVAFSKYESDDLIPDTAMANLLRVAIADASFVSRLQELRSPGTTASIRLYDAPVVASPSATWVNETDMEEDETSPNGAEFTASSTGVLSAGEGQTWMM